MRIRAQNIPVARASLLAGILLVLGIGNAGAMKDGTPVNSDNVESGKMERRHETGADWARSMEAFYKATANNIVDTAKSRNANAIRLLPQTNTSGFHCASPCNEGLAVVLRKALNEAGLDETELLFWHEPMYPGRLSALLNRPLAGWWSAMAPQNNGHPYDSLAWTQQGWFKVDKEGRMQAATMPKGTDALSLRLFIPLIALSNGAYEAQFAVASETDGLQEKIFDDSYSGDANQAYWFVREKTNAWTVWLVFGLMFLVAIMLIVLSRYLSGQPLDPIKIGYMCCLLGLFLTIVFLALAPLPRQMVRFYETTRLHYIVDRSGEVWFSGIPEGKTGYPAFARSLEEGIRSDEELLNEKTGWELGFISWLWSDYMTHSMADIYREERFELNMPFDLDIYEYSGDPRLEWDPVDSVSPDPEPHTLGLGSRIINPLDELTRRATTKQAGLRERNIVIHLTGGCAGSMENLKEYRRSVNNAQKSSDYPESVFTIAAPTLPRTGDPASYNYESGKLSLLALASDRLIILNDRVSPDALSSSEDWHGVRSHLNKTNRSTTTTLRSVPMYSNLPDLNSRQKWDRPRDLDARRQKKLVTSKEAAEKSCQGVVAELKNLISATEPVKEEFRTIHVLGRTPFPWLALALAGAVIIGFLALARQYYDISFRDFYNDARRRGFRIRFSHSPLVAGIVLFIVFFFLVWLTRIQYNWTDFGSPTWALLAVSLCWLTWVVGSRLFSRWWMRSGDEPSHMGIFLIVIISALPVAFVTFLFGNYITPAVNNHIEPDKAVWFVSLLGMALLAGWALSCLPRSGAANVKGGAGKDIRLYQWPLLSIVVKVFLLLCVLVLFRGAFPASPLGGAWGILSYIGFVGFVAAVLSAVGLAVAVTDWRLISDKYGILVAMCFFVPFVLCISVGLLIVIGG